MNNKEKKELKKRKKEKGFSAAELLGVALVVLVVAAIFLVIALQTSYDEKYDTFQNSATQFGVQATGFQFQDTKNEIFLKELVDKEAISPVKNPFHEPKFCDTANSKVSFASNGTDKYVTLKCGEYLIDNEPVSAKKFTIYKVSEWSEKKKHDDDEEIVLYNYKKDGKDGFSEFYEANMFLYALNEQYGTFYWDVSVVPAEYGVYSKTFYRTKTKVATVDTK